MSTSVIRGGFRSRSILGNVVRDTGHLIIWGAALEIYILSHSGVMMSLITNVSPRSAADERTRIQL